MALELGLNALRESWLPSFSSLPLAGEITEGEAGCEDFFNSLPICHYARPDLFCSQWTRQRKSLAWKTE